MSDNTWIDRILPLPRPEYAKQTEVLLTALLWQSQGSSLAKLPNHESSGFLQELGAFRRLVPALTRGTNDKVLQTLPIAQTFDISSVVACENGGTSPVPAMLRSLIAPKSRGDKSIAIVPLHPALCVLQTHSGLVNKNQPPDLAKAIETVGRMGGSPCDGSVAALFLNSLESNNSPVNGLPGAIEALFPSVATFCWNNYRTQMPEPKSEVDWEEWPNVCAANLDVSECSELLLASKAMTPFSWFWSKWQVLCDPANRWHEVLPTRRYVDWALSLLRTGLAFAYLWEAEFFIRIHDMVKQRADSPSSPVQTDSLQALLSGNVPLANVEHPSIPASQKNAWTALKSLINRGYVARDRIGREVLSNGDTIDVCEIAKHWIEHLDDDHLNKLARPLQVGTSAPNNTREFVRYLIQPRASDDDLADQADFYYLARTNSRNLWFEPGPEWLVVVTSLLCSRAGGECTLGMLLDDLAALGMKVERWVLVTMLEEAGLSTDSPDADNALVIKSGF